MAVPAYPMREFKCLDADSSEVKENSPSTLVRANNVSFGIYTRAAMQPSGAANPNPNPNPKVVGA